MLTASAVLCVGAYLHLKLIYDLRGDSAGGKGYSSRRRGSKSKKGTCNVAENLLCPITLELPLDPVTCEDGRIYERKAIEKYFATKAEKNKDDNNKDGSSQIKSPITNEPMGNRVMAAPQHRNLIEALIETGTLPSELSEKWLEKVREKKNAEVLLKRATQNDAKAMEKVAINYFRGENGFQEDDKQAYLWFKKCHQTGNSVLGTAHMGYMLASGVGVTRNKKDGILFLGIAAGRGSDMAAYRLGMAWADGKYGLHINNEEAAYWLKLSLSGDCACKTMNEKSTQKAKQKLDEVLGRTSDASALNLD